MTQFKRVMIQIFIIVLLFIGMLAVLGREKLADENPQFQVSFGTALSHGWNLLVMSINGLKAPVAVQETPGEISDCAYQWASQPLPDTTKMIRDKLATAGIKNISIKAEAYGENCIHLETGEIGRFLPMQTDIRIRVEVDQVSNKENLGSMLEKFLELFSTIPPEKLPGPNPGMIEASFFASDGELNLWFSAAEGQRVLAEGKRGADLISFLQH